MLPHPTHDCVTFSDTSARRQQSLPRKPVTTVSRTRWAQACSRCRLTCPPVTLSLVVDPTGPSHASLLWSLCLGIMHAWVSFVWSLITGVSINCIGRQTWVPSPKCEVTPAKHPKQQQPQQQQQQQQQSGTNNNTRYN